MGRRSEGWKLRKPAGSPYWYVRFTSPDGRRIEKSTGCRKKTEAAREAAKVYAEAVGGDGLTPPPVGAFLLETLFAEWLESLEGLKSPEWLETLELYAGVHWLTRWTHSTELTEPAIRRYISERRKVVAGSTISKELSGLRQFLKWAKSEGYVARVPTWETPESSSDYEAICLSREETEAVLAQLPDRSTHPKHLPVREYFTVMYATSFRRGTLARIRWADVDLDGGAIRVASSADKRKFGRVVPLTAAAVSALASLKAGLEASGVAPLPTSLVFGKRNFVASLRKAAERAGIPEERRGRGLANHALRHSRLTDLASRSQNIPAIQHMAGHKTLASTMRYVHASEQQARKLLEDIGEAPEPGGDSGGIVGEERISRRGENSKS